MKNRGDQKNINNININNININIIAEYQFYGQDITIKMNFTGKCAKMCFFTSKYLFYTIIGV